MRSVYLTLRAHDFGTPSLYSEVPLVVYVQDVNDNEPHFEQDIYKQSIPEDLKGGSTILQVGLTLFILYNFVNNLVSRNKHEKKIERLHSIDRT